MSVSGPDVDALFEDDPGPLDGDLDDDEDDLKLDGAETKVWLVKVPRFLASKWNAIDQDNVNLGNIRIYERPPPGRTSRISLILPEDDADNIPREYAIHIPPEEVKNKYVLTENENGGRSISGKVHHECSATPTSLDAYRGIMRKRVRDAGTPQRTVQVLGQDNQPVFAPGASSQIPSTGFSDFITPKRPRPEKEKATRMPRNELMDMLFAAFERYPYWSFKGLLEHTKQPAQYLREILSEICILNKQGPYASNYQLKPEYKHRPSAAERSAEAEGGGHLSSEEEDEEEPMETIHV